MSSLNNLQYSTDRFSSNELNEEIEEIALERELNELYTTYEDLKQQVSVEKERRRKAERREECLWELLRRRVKDNLDLIDKIEVLRVRRKRDKYEIRSRGNWHGERDEHYPSEYTYRDRNMQMRDSNAGSSREQEHYDIGQHRRSANASSSASSSEKADKPRRNRERENEQRVRESEQEQTNKARDQEEQSNSAVVVAAPSQIRQEVSEVVDRRRGGLGVVEKEKRKSRIPLPQQLSSLISNNQSPRAAGIRVRSHRDTY